MVIFLIKPIIWIDLDNNPGVMQVNSGFIQIRIAVPENIRITVRSH